MERNVSIVKVDGRHYRAIAKENWGLTLKQMRGMHVHHRIKRSDGGTNDPSNLYVCSEWYHDNVWHAGEGGFTGCASRGGREGGIKGGKRAFEEKLGIFNQDYLSSPLKHEHAVRAGSSGKGSKNPGQAQNPTP